MPPLLAKALFSLLVWALEKSGILTKIEAGAVRAGDGFVRTVEHLKTYPEYPTQKGMPSPAHTSNNLNQ